ncbi:unnamed protein product [Penicillium glandicola]
MAYRPAGMRMSVSQSPVLLKRGRDSDDSDDSSPSPTRRRLESDESDESEEEEKEEVPAPYPIPDSNSTSSEGKTPSTTPDTLNDDRPPLSEEAVWEFHRKGAEYQRWIADPTLDGCKCGRSSLTLFELFNNSNRKARFHCISNHFGDPPEHIAENLEESGLPSTEKKYRFATLTHHGPDKDGYKSETEFTGPNWSNVALAQYTFDHPIDTLKYLYFINVQNKETLPYVQESLYPRWDIDWPMVNKLERQIWEHGTHEYQEILGTALGKAAACLVLGAWDRGTHRIARVHTLGRDYQIHLRFDIEPLPGH